MKSGANFSKIRCKQVNIVIENGCDSLQVNSCDQVEVKGDVLRAGGTVVIHGNVLNKVDADGSVQCGNVSGNVNAGGSIRCGSVSGSVNAGGSVTYR